jgi:hypothetical protein
MARGTRLRKEVEWRERLARFARASTSVVQFCLEEGVSTPSFYAWRKRLAGETGAWTQSQDARGRHSAFAPVRLIGQTNGSDQITACLRGGTRLAIPLVDSDAVRGVLAALVRADAEHAGGQPC